MKLRALVLGLAVVVVGGLLTPGASAKQRPGTFERHAITSDAGTYDYMVYVPAGVRPGRPLVVIVPGAMQTAESAAHDTEFNALAARRKFVVLYPEANIENGGYFDYDDEVNQHRDSGEAAVIAAMTRRVAREWRSDRKRIYIGGASNGSAMANLMLAAYPDVYALPFSHSGGTYKCDGGAVIGCRVTAEESARAVIAEMGRRGRVIPFIVFHGADDRTVPPADGEKIVKTWQLVADRFDDGRSNGSIPTKPRVVRRGVVKDGHPYTVSKYVDGRGRALGEYWLVEGMRHAYSGGPANTPQGIAIDPESERKVSAAGTDPAGPKATRAAYRFFLEHPLRGR
jgi:poly(hydroxyalkanoate) depolymerase family esterase